MLSITRPGSLEEDLMALRAACGWTIHVSDAPMLTDPALSSARTGARGKGAPGNSLSTGRNIRR
jgi:hypothetical protein